MSVLKYSFEDIESSIFLRLGWDCLTTPPLFYKGAWFWGNLTP